MPVAHMSGDVLVVGGGMAGVSIGAELADKCRVILVEGEAQLAFHSTGRSAAMYLPSYGGRVVRAVTEASREGYDEISEERGEPLLTSRSLLWVAFDDQGDVAVRTLAAESAAVDLVAADVAIDLCPVLRPDLVRFAGLDAAGMEIDVAGLHQAYLRRFRARGGIVVLASPVTDIAPRATGWRVTAGQQQIEVDHIVDAAGAWADRVAEMAGIPSIGLVPKRRSAFLSPVATSYEGMDRWPMVDDGAEGWYFKPEAGGLLVSPADATPVEPHDARPEEIEIARAIEAINECTVLGLRSVSHSWAGLRSFVHDEIPVVGARSDHPGFFFFAGQGGYGIQMAPALARIGASLLLNGTLASDLVVPDISAETFSPDRLGG